MADESAPSGLRGRSEVAESNSSGAKLPADIGARKKLSIVDHQASFSVEDLTSETNLQVLQSNDFAAQSSADLKVYSDSELASIYRDAVTKFNIKPKACRDFLISKRVIRGLPSEFAQFILDQPKISKRRIGEFIGGVDKLNQLVCEELFSRYDFKGNTLDEALRKLLRQFRLPGEAQQIDRILEKFATQYHMQNPGVFLTSDTAYVLSFSIIMLNTDLHNQAIAPEKKMTLEQFIRNNRGINQGEDVNRDILERLYRDIKENEISMDESDMYENEVVAFMAPTKSGTLFSRPLPLLCSRACPDHDVYCILFRLAS
jgi:Sec7-like guanine-nucleotide exchange factor